MFDALIARLFRRRPPSIAPRKSVDSRAVATAPAVGERRTSTRATIPVGVGARRPLVAVSGALAGFEFHAGATASARLRRREDEAVAHAYLANVLGAMRLCVGQNLIALTQLPVSWLARFERLDLFVPGMHIALQLDASIDNPQTLGALADRLRGSGALVGWRPASAPTDRAPAGRPDFIALHMPPASEASAWQGEIDSAASRWPGVSLVLLDLPDVDVMEAMLRPPVIFAACAMTTKVVPTRVQSLPPQAQRLLGLLNHLVRDDDNAVLVSDIKSDAALSLRLLHYLNSAGASPGRQLDSIDQAVMVLGRDALYSWVAQMLVRMSPPRPAADALQALALARARLLELLARTAGASSPGTLYLLGLASMLPLLLRCSLDDAVASLRLPSTAMEALRQKTGPWAPYLELAQALETHDMLMAEALAAHFGGLDVVMGQWAQAWLPT